MSILDNLPHIATAQVRTRITGELGGSKDSFSTVFSGRACWQQAAGDREIEEFAKWGIQITDKVYFVVDPGVNEEYQLVIDGKTYDVRSFAERDASVGKAYVWRVMVDRHTTED